VAHAEDLTESAVRPSSPEIDIDIDARAVRLRMLLFDVDGVLTDGSVTVHDDGSESKSFFIRDGAALVWARREGLKIGLLSGRSSAATTRRAAELGIPIVVQGVHDKGAACSEILEAHGLGDLDVAYMGDDLLDLPVLTRAGLSAAPADAVDEVRARVHWVSAHAGGRGAVREFIELILKARGRWSTTVSAIGGS
jgi:3-deoxy-D-manno-octulosonate 8-phosphate phosphatase (KDO 8-P phosphatase)